MNDFWAGFEKRAKWPLIGSILGGAGGGATGGALSYKTQAHSHDKFLDREFWNIARAENLEPGTYAYKEKLRQFKEENAPDAKMKAKWALPGAAFGTVAGAGTGYLAGSKIPGWFGKKPKPAPKAPSKPAMALKGIANKVEKETGYKVPDEVLDIANSAMESDIGQNIMSMLGVSQ